MSIRNSNIKLSNANQGGPSFYPSQFASFCEMGNISELIFKNRFSNKDNDKNGNSQNSSNNHKSENNNIKKTLKNNNNDNSTNCIDIKCSPNEDTIKYEPVT